MCHEVRGSGPLLLMLLGAPADAGGFAALTGLYTGVTHDTRSTSRSSLRT